MSPAEWDQLNLRLDEQFGHLHERLDTLQAGLHALECNLTARLDAHDTYHAANEPHWGPERLAQRHPFRTALAAAAFTWLIFFATPQRALKLGKTLMNYLLPDGGH